MAVREKLVTNDPYANAVIDALERAGVKVYTAALGIFIEPDVYKLSLGIVFTEEDRTQLMEGMLDEHSAQ